MLITHDEGGDFYHYFIKHSEEPTEDELNLFLKAHANDRDGDEIFEYIYNLIELPKTFNKIPKKK